MADLKRKGELIVKNLVNISLFYILLVAVSCSYAQQTETQLIDILKSDATAQQKTDACIELSKIGTQQAVAPLSALLDNAELAHMAVYALEPNRDPAAGEALRAAAGRLTGCPRLIVIHALGMRRDTQAVGMLCGLLSGSDKDAADAAAAALSRIGTPQAIEALKQALNKVPAAAEGLLRYAETAPSEQVAALCDALRKPPFPLPVRAAAMRRVVLSRGENGMPLLVEQLRGNDVYLFNAALRTASELPCTPKVTRAFNEELKQLSDDRKPLLMGIIAERGDESACPALLAYVKTGTSSVRAASVRALARLGCREALSIFAEVVTDKDRTVADAAFSALSGMPGTDADNATMSLLNNPDLSAKKAGIRLAAERRLHTAIPCALKMAADADSEIRNGSLKVLKDLAGEQEVPALLEVISKSQDPDAVADVLNTVCLRQAAAKAGSKKPANISVNRIPPELAGPIFAVYEKAQGASKQALIRTLMLIADNKALTYVRTAASGTDTPLREKAYRTLCEWPADNALPDLEKFAASANSPKAVIMAVRGFVRLTAVRNAPIAEKSAALCRAFGWAARDEERRSVLDALTSAPTLESLALAAASLEREGLQEEACRSAVAIGESLVFAEPEKVAEIMTKVVSISKNKELLKRSAAVQAQTKAALLQKKAAADEAGFKPMFNGKDLSEWDGKSTFWKVVDGLLTGETTPENPCKKSAYMLWKGGTPGDFELRTEFRLSKDANSGIHFRAGTVHEPVSGSYRFDPKAAGYQADMSGDGKLVGFFWHPVLFLTARGATVTLNADGKKTEQRFADSQAIQSLYKAGEWNSYRLICRGPEITLYLNGELAARLIDHTPAAPKKGAIMLQVHQGKPMKAEYRNLRIKML